MLSPPRAAARGPGSVPEDASGRLERLLRHLQEAGTDIKRGAEPSRAHGSPHLHRSPPQPAASASAPQSFAAERETVVEPIDRPEPQGLLFSESSPDPPGHPSSHLLTMEACDANSGPRVPSTPSFSQPNPNPEDPYASPQADPNPEDPYASPQADRHPTGWDEIDRLLGGGLPRGRLCEIAGPASCGRTSLAHALLARTTAAGELACVIDRADAFDPTSARDGGTDLSRVLWARPPGVTEALRCAEHVLRAKGFALVLLDLAMANETPRLSSAIWPRLRKIIASGSAAFVVLSHKRVVGSFADLALELDEVTPSFESGPSWLAGLEGRVLVARNRTGPDQRSVAVRWWSHEERAA